MGPVGNAVDDYAHIFAAGFAPHVADEGVDLGVDIGCGELFVDYGVDAGGNADAQPFGLERAGYHFDVDVDILRVGFQIV